MSSLFVLLALLAPDAGPAVVDVGDPVAPASAAPASGAAPAAPETAAPKPSGPPPEVTFACAPSPVKVGEVLACTLTALHREDVSITVTAPPAFKADKGGPPVKQADGRLKTERVLRMQPLEPRPELKVSGLRVIWREASGAEGSMDVAEQVVPIQRLLLAESDPKFKSYEEPQGDAAAFFERHGAVPYRVVNWPLIIGLWIVGGVLLGLIIGRIVWKIIDARRHPPGPPVDPRPAHVIALSALDALSAEAQTTSMEVKAYYSRLSEIIRAYLERRYHFTALEMTSDEIRREARSMDLRHEAGVAIDRFLDETDLVKFAAHLPASGDADTVMLAARGLIQITRQSDDELAAEAEA